MELSHAVDNLCLYDPGFSGYAEAFAKDLGGSSETMAVSSMDDLRAAIGKFTSVKFLEVVLHGTPGMIHLANGGGMVGSYLGTLIQGTPFLQKDSRVLFASCDIAKGEIGDKFMADIAKKMFTGKGGTLGASTVSNIVFFPKASFALGAYLSAFSDGTLKVRRYDLSGNQVGERNVDRYGHTR